MTLTPSEQRVFDVIKTAQPATKRIIVKRTGMNPNVVAGTLSSLVRKGRIGGSGSIRSVLRKYHIIVRKPASGISDIDEFIARKGVTKCPTVTADGALQFKPMMFGLGGRTGRGVTS